MAKTDYLEAQILNWLSGSAFATAPTTLYVGLSTTAPAEDGTNITEPDTGDGYARQAVSLAAIVQGANQATRATDAEITFGPATASWGTVTHAFLADAVTAGNPLYHNALSSSRVIGNGDSARFTTGQLIVGEQ